MAECLCACFLDLHSEAWLVVVLASIFFPSTSPQITHGLLGLKTHESCSFLYSIRSLFPLAIRVGFFFFPGDRDEPFLCGPHPLLRHRSGPLWRSWPCGSLATRHVRHGEAWTRVDPRIDVCI